jgi:magnesium chelatase family protein
MIERYRTRLSGPMLDRIDLQVEVPRVPHSDLADTRAAEASVEIRGRVEQAREIQQARFSRLRIHCNARMGPSSHRPFAVPKLPGRIFSNR